MTIQSDQFFESFVPVYDVVPEKWEDARQFLVEHLKKISNAVNIREIGWFLDQELLSGKQFTPGTSSANDQQFRSVLRKVIDFGALPAAGTKSIAHGITFDANFSLIDLFISATDPVAFNAFSLQYWSQNAADSIRINMDATNINVIVNANYSAYTRSFVVIEYIQEI